jgi:S-disulfanyl-L-cysteine oxidoreductase SoxD
MTTRRHAIAKYLGMVGAIVLSAACHGDQRRAVVQQGNAAPPASDVRPTPSWPKRVDGIGRRALPAEQQAWNIDVNPTGAGLPAGSGTYVAGATLFAQRCAACHGMHGEGLATYPKLIGRDPRAGFSFGEDYHLAKTIGNYWPYSTTLYDYIHRAMPLTAPGSLQPNEIYSVIAYLLAENQIIDKRTVVDARSLPRIRMPARDRFVVDDRTGGPVFR